MKKLLPLFACLSLTFILSANEVNWKEGFVTGNPEINSINNIAFGPESILFVGDASSAQIVALDLSEYISNEPSEFSQMEKVDQMLADQMGAAAEDIRITDMAVHPTSKDIFLSVVHGGGKSILVKVVGESFEMVDLTNINHSLQVLKDPIASNAVDRRERPLRKWAISDLNFRDGKVLVTGLSNQEFGSTFRMIDFPFKNNQSYGSLEIYHAAHGKYETNSPIKTFTTVEIEGEPHVVAGYTCTPLVVFPMSDLKSGQHTMGRTVAELGNWNTPLDMVEMAKEGKRYILLANSSRALMKIDLEDIANFKGSLTERIEKRSGTAGIDFIALPFVNVQQLDRYDNESFLMLQRTAEGDLVMKKGESRWL